MSYLLTLFRVLFRLQMTTGAKGRSGGGSAKVCLGNGCHNGRLDEAYKE